MNCKEIGGHLLDIAGGAIPDAATEAHLAACDACAEKLASLVQTMSLLDEWRAPEPTPYFDTRLHAQLRSEAVQPGHSWLGWLRKPALAMAMAGLLAIGITLVQHNTQTETQPPAQAELRVQPGSAVADLQNLDKNHDIYADFDLLDDLDSADNPAGQDVNP